MAEFSTLPPHLRSAYANDPRYLRSQAMRKQAEGIQDIRHPLQGLAQMLMAYKSGQGAKDVRSDYDEKGTAYNQALGRALGMIQPGTEEIPAAGPPTAMGDFPTATRDVPADYAGAAQEMAKVGGPLATQLAIAGSQRTQGLQDLASKRAYDEAQAKIVEERAIERFRAEQEIKQDYPTPASGRPASPIQNFARRQELVEEFGEGTPEVRRFDDYVRATQYKDIGGSIAAMSPVTPGEPVAELLKTLEPEQEPEYKAEAAQATAAGTKIGAKNADQFFAVKHAFNQREDIAKLVDHLKTSTAITGAGAELFKNLERAKALIGSKVASGVASDTEILDVMMGKEVFPMIKALGVGARGMDTPAEREFMRSVLTGSINLNKTTLLKMAEIRSNVAERTINNWNKRMDSGELDRFYESQGIPKTRFELDAPIDQPDPTTGGTVIKSDEELLNEYLGGSE